MWSALIFCPQIYYGGKEMEQDKTKILSDLYAIRATMSVVAENDDEAEAEDKKVSECKQSISRLKDDRSQREKDVEQILYGYTINNEIAHLQQELSAKESELKDLQEKESKACDALNKCGGYFGKAVNAFFDYVSNDYEYEGFYSWEAPMFLTLGTAIIFYLIGWGIYAHGLKKDDKRKKREALNQVICEENDCINEIDRLKVQIAALKQREDSGHRYLVEKTDVAEEQERSLKQYYIQVAQDIAANEENIPKHLEIIDNLSEKSKAIVQSAVKAYPLIDFRDWENVDLLIYYFETGRADDMKEALQLVDRQRQTDQITRALSIASASICKTFDNTMRQLGSSLAQSFTVLSRQMARQHAEMMYRMDQQAADWREMSEAQNRELRGLREQAAAEMSMQVSAQAMNQALLDKISVSSKHLAEQMDRQMREVHGLY